MDIWFYHLQRQSIEKALPALLEKTLQRGLRAVVQLRSEERLTALDDWLWTYSDSSFLPHGRERDGDFELQPVYLTLGAENPNGAKIRFFIEGSDLAGAFAAPETEAYERAILMFDGNQDDELEAARGQWKALKEKGFLLTYWQQDDNGRWEKKA